MAGIESVRLFKNNGGIIEPALKSGVKIITMSSLLPPGSAPVIWRGPMKMRAIDQFLSEINWGELDYLIIDSPPGTGDEPLSIIQRIPEMDGAIIVTTPQDVALDDAKRTVNFARALGVPVLGIIENMSGFVCPHCGEKSDIFKTGGGERAAREMGIDFFGRLPIEPSVMFSGDSGKPFVTEGNSESAKAIIDITNLVLEKVGTKKPS
jgi:Mrp family chromosome partitioning ATPase